MELIPEGYHHQAALSVWFETANTAPVLMDIVGIASDSVTISSTLR